jgi:hypothetical protein
MRAAFPDIVEGFAESPIHSQRLPNLDEQRGIVRKLLDKIVDLLLQRHLRTIAQPRTTPQPRFRDKKNKHRHPPDVCPHTAPTNFTQPES